MSNPSRPKKRVYPTAQYVAPSSPSMPFQGGAFSGQTMQSQVSGSASPYMAPSGQFTQPMNASDAQNQPQFMTPAQQQLKQQISQATTSMNDMHLHNVPVIDPNAYYQPNNGNNIQPTGENKPSLTPGRPTNNLYPVDILTELPPKINDLNLLPPPILLEPEISTKFSESVYASPDYIRSTLNAVPQSNALLKKSKLPFALIIKPFKHLHDMNAPLPCNEDEFVIRCRRCRGYLNPFVKILQVESKWRCNFCGCINGFPDGSEHFQLPNLYNRNELTYSSMDFLPSSSYSQQVKEEPPAVYTFVIDVSINTIKNGYLFSVANALVNSLDLIPNHDNKTLISLICADSSLHYFSVPLDTEDGPKESSMFDISDLDEPFLPTSNSLLVSLSQCRNNLEHLLLKIPEIFKSTTIQSFALGPALQNASELVKDKGGKVIVCSSTLPNMGIGKLNPRDERGISNTSKESKDLLSCQDAFYRSFTVECNKLQITIDLFIASGNYMDIATLSNLSKYTGGQTHFYPQFLGSVAADFTKFSKEFSRHLSMDLSFRTVMRPRCSIGLRIEDSYGHLFNRSTDLCSFPAMPRDQSYVVELSIEDKLTADYCYAQIAFLYSTGTGKRKIRVLTLALPTTTILHNVFASADQLAIATYFARIATEKVMKNSFDHARSFLNTSLEEILINYRKEIVVENNAGGVTLRFSTNLKMLPLLVHMLLKNIAFRKGVIPSDLRAIALNNMESLPLKYLIKNAYPTVYSLHDIPDEAGLPDENGVIVMPPPMNDTISSFEKYGLYLINTPNELILWVGGNAIPELVSDVFGLQDVFQVPNGKNELPELPESEFNQRLRSIIENIRANDDEQITYQTLYIVRGNSQNEPANSSQNKEIVPLRNWAVSFLVEDNVVGCESYREFLQNLKTRLNK
ncbi:hypothetical protein NCAS_0B06380 [Naumovozyma castellii]|uniref:Protein transport protein SEC24-2 n=1 Tax=Naumovozyma castellii TaxID=27288 RepID=SC242_NAUCA|nr:hypothetical protein NCAS_0B06380 [Naumovozyma castellii CBS 4309]Q875V7.1 RecName: Full=Protein transport protein SEC24-2 [Naumovozyma castellii CBS 4309]AAO32525.1 SEC24 [Naumovozyma castellii]CCC68722.1 hypothetical protein NCAS_0B06380 [Naumovozyma castellii CBS 4309]